MVPHTNRGLVGCLHLCRIPVSYPCCAYDYRSIEADGPCYVLSGLLLVDLYEFIPLPLLERKIINKIVLNEYYFMLKGRKICPVY